MENSGIFVKGVKKPVENEKKKSQRSGFLSMLLGTLLGYMLCGQTRKVVVRDGEGKKEQEDF